MRFLLNTALLALFIINPCRSATSVCNQDLYSNAVTENGMLVAKGSSVDYNGVSQA
jgi:hypothetical protein